MKRLLLAALLILAGTPAWAQVAPDGGGSINLSATFTRPANTTAYASGQLIANSTTAGSVVPMQFTLPGGAPIVVRVRLSTNVTTGWGSGSITVNLWSCKPTYTSGDGAAYAISAGGSCWIGSFPITLTQYGDAASGEGSPTVGNNVVLPPGAVYYADLTSGSSLTPISGQTFTLTLEVAY